MSWAGDGVQQPAGDLVGIGIEESNPAQRVDSSQFFQQKRQPIFQAEVFAIAGGVLANQGDFANACLRQPFCLGDYRFKPARPKLAAQLRNDAERARMIAALRDLDVGGVSRRSQNARRGFVVEIVWQIGDCAVPTFARKTALAARASPSGRDCKMLKGELVAGR